MLWISRDGSPATAEDQESNIVVYENGAILGYGVLYQDEIRSLFVHPLSRGKGSVVHCLLT